MEIANFYQMCVMDCFIWEYLHCIRIMLIYRSHWDVRKLLAQRDTANKCWDTNFNFGALPLTSLSKTLLFLLTCFETSVKIKPKSKPLSKSLGIQRVIDPIFGHIETLNSKNSYNGMEIPLWLLFLKYAGLKYSFYSINIGKCDN